MVFKCNNRIHLHILIKTANESICSDVLVMKLVRTSERVDVSKQSLVLV